MRGYDAYDDVEQQWQLNRRPVSCSGSPQPVVDRCGGNFQSRFYAFLPVHLCPSPGLALSCLIAQVLHSIALGRMHEQASESLKPPLCYTGQCIQVASITRRKVIVTMNQSTSSKRSKPSHPFHQPPYTSRLPPPTVPLPPHTSHLSPLAQSKRRSLAIFSPPSRLHLRLTLLRTYHRPAHSPNPYGSPL
jgi:hypothetical protein